MDCSVPQPACQQMDDECYWGDISETERQSANQADEDSSCSSQNDRHYIDYDRFFRNIPPRRRRRCDKQRLRQQTSSLYYTSRWLHQYFLNQKVDLRRQAEIVIPVIPDLPLKQTLGKPEAIHIMTSGRHLSVGDAISFSLFPRVLIESDMPHRVVHANAAYSRRYGCGFYPAAPQPHMFTAPGVETHRDLELAVSSLFDPADSLVMYPVRGSDLGNAITHYLVEASCNPAAFSSPSFASKAKPWSKTEVARAIA